jgi:hypothetical protein
LFFFLLIPDLASSHYYSVFFRTLTTQGGVNAWLADAISLLFAAAVYKSLRLALFNKQRREMGWALLLVSFVVFNLLMYACTRSIVAVEDGQNFVQRTGESKAWYYVTDTGDWELLPAPGFHPRTGEPLKPMTPDAARDYQAWKRQQEARNRQDTAESEKQAKAKAERQFRETYVNDAVVSSAASADSVILALKSDPSDSQGDALQGLLAELLARKGKHPVSGAFKPAFYARGMFDDLCGGDQSVLGRLRLFDGAPGCLLLCKPSLSDASKTDFEGLVSVQGTLSLILVTDEGRRGPWVFKASGAGVDRATASANCAKRLIEEIDVDVVFQK